jgi:hypothetical protein
LLRRGAALGLVTYATYDLTNWAVLKGWPVLLVPVDVGWGIALTAVVALALLCFVGAPVWLLCTAAADVVGDRGRSWPRTRALGFFGLYLACEVAGVVLATLLWIATLGGRIGGPLRYLDANAALQRWWTAPLFKGSVWLFSMNVHVEGLELARSGRDEWLFERWAELDDWIAPSSAAEAHSP